MVGWWEVYSRLLIGSLVTLGSRWPSWERLAPWVDLSLTAAARGVITAPADRGVKGHQAQNGKRAWAGDLPALPDPKGVTISVSLISELFRSSGVKGKNDRIARG